jgi:hypothetical protein
MPTPEGLDWEPSGFYRDGESLLDALAENPDWPLKKQGPGKYWISKLVYPKPDEDPETRSEPGE